MTRELDSILQGAWRRVREKHLYPELPAPRLAPAGGNASLDLFAKTITIGEGAVEALARPLSAGEVVEALLDHAVSHHLYCPWNFGNHLALYAQAKQVLGDPALARRAADAFMDAAADIACVSRVATPLPDLYRRPAGSRVETVLRALYQYLWQRDLGVSCHAETARRLARIAYRDPARWPAGMRRFATLMRPHLLSDAHRPDADRAPLPPTGGHSLRSYGRREIELGLRSLAAGVATPAEFRAIVADFEGDLGSALSPEAGGAGCGAGTADHADALFYMKRAETLRLPIRALPRKTGGALYPQRHLPWEAGRPCQDIDPWASFGKIMPGVTKTWKRACGTVFGEEERIPDCMVLIDSSSSMPNPRQRLSHAVLGGGCACDAYLRNGARVAVCNFGDAARGGSRVHGYSRDRAALYRVLCTYLGGGTHLDPALVESLQGEPPPDIFMITDMQIANLDPVIDYLGTCPNRVTAVHTANSPHADRFRRRVDPRANVAIFAVTAESDIPRIIVGRVKDCLYRRSADPFDARPAGNPFPDASGAGRPPADSWRRVSG